MTLDLMNLAKQADNAYRDVQCSFGVIRVYHVPDTVLLSEGRLDKSEPELPTVRMKIATGYQNRQAKQGDKEYDDYQKAISAYWNETSDMRNAAHLVLALKDIDWSDYDISKPPPSERAQEMYNGHWPENELLRKRAWLDWTVMFKRVDSEAIFAAMAELRGENEPTEEGVDEVKKNSG